MQIDDKEYLTEFVAPVPVWGSKSVIVDEVARMISGHITYTPIEKLLDELCDDTPPYQRFDAWVFAPKGQFERERLDRRIHAEYLEFDEVYDLALQRILGNIPYERFTFIDKARVYYEKIENDS